MNHSFTHSGLPDCASPIVTVVPELPDFPGIYGTGFFTRKENKIFFLTARHCLIKSDDEDLESALSRVQIPYTLSGFKSTTKDYAQVGCAYSFQHKDPEIPGRFVDFVVLKIKTDIGSTSEKKLLSRAVKLPPDGKWLDEYIKSNEVAEFMSKGISLPLIITGYPCESANSIVERTVSSQLTIISGYMNYGKYPHTMTFSDIVWEKSLNGFSGSPVFIRFSNRHGNQYVLAGMVITGGNRQGQFIKVSSLMNAYGDESTWWWRN